MDEHQLWDATFIFVGTFAALDGVGIVAYLRDRSGKHQDDKAPHSP